MTRPYVEVYTDGSADRFGRGGWAALLRYEGREKLLSGGEAATTNNRMELRAALEALRALKRPCVVVVYTDSQYLQKAFAEGWLERWQRNGWRTRAGAPVKNQDLWRALLEEIRRHEVRWRWVEGHAGHPENERVDREAQRRRRSLPRPET
ncbi:ribonuclease HI [Marinithermus hydrothermalis]|uniref:Ribonuclease H n=1 Tax=Marinithermus hydrothermalis (strain DSM 14884 / JCM 11576 / T1) TaxID=869210 RepID=F2NQD4_MARHT|nr:ribonuclease HI [Marinithermus hydrothermalis]AEB11661.1 Ribonuclease H [Marinithermus hydrothermalis DSM 14884]